MSSKVFFKGSLKLKRKGDLVEIADALNLTDYPSSLKREELEEQIRQVLLSNKAYFANHDSFKGLISSLDVGESMRKKTARSSSINGNLDSDVSDSPEALTRTPRKHSQLPSEVPTLATASTPTSSAAADIAASVKKTTTTTTTKAPKSLGHITDTARSGTEEINSNVEQVQQQFNAAIHSFPDKTLQTYHNAKNCSYKAFVSTRNWLSDSKHLAFSLLILEGLVLLFSVVPITVVHVGKNGLINPNNGWDSHLLHWAVSIPNLQGLVTLAFWRPIFLWTLYSFLIPGAIAHLITFDRKFHPSPFSFLMARVSALVLLTRVLPNSTVTSSPFLGSITVGETLRSSPLLVVCSLTTLFLSISMLIFNCEHPSLSSDFLYTKPFPLDVGLLEFILSLFLFFFFYAIPFVLFVNDIV